jgi:hypothetical protein
MPEDPFVRKKFTRAHSFARRLAKEYFEKYPKDRYYPDLGKDRTLAPDPEEPHPARQLLPAWRS